MISERIPIEKDVMIWARDSARLDKETAAKKLGVSLSKLESWENGDISPTISQLRKAANLYKRPLAVLFLSKPPEDFDKLPDYRSARDMDTIGLSHALTIEIRRAHSQREVMLEIGEVAPESAPVSKPLPDVSEIDDPEQMGKLLRNFLGFSMGTPRSTGNGSDSLRAWISALEAQGILVLYLRNVEPDEVSGFSISVFPYPVIAINGRDLHRRRLFTLLHELAHITLKSGGVCDLHENAVNKSSPPKDDLEARCNAIAAATLMQAEEVRKLPELATKDKSTYLNPTSLWELSKPFGVSSESFLLRLVSLGLASWEDYWKIKPQLSKFYIKAQDREKQKQKESSGGPSYYRIKADTLGHRYIASVLDAHAADDISSLDAADYLELKYNQIPKLEAVLT